MKAHVFLLCARSLWDFSGEHQNFEFYLLFLCFVMLLLGSLSRNAFLIFQSLPPTSRTSPSLCISDYPTKLLYYMILPVTRYWLFRNGAASVWHNSNIIASSSVARARLHTPKSVSSRKVDWSTRFQTLAFLYWLSLTMYGQQLEILL